MTRKHFRKHSFDFDFFDSKNPSRLQFYWAGFIAADGSVNRKCLNIGLSTKDINHLYKFKEHIKGTQNITIRNCIKSINGNLPKEYESCHINIYSVKLVNDLKYFGIENKKSLTYDIPDHIINHEYFNSFLLGLSDGDGCFCETKRKITWSIVGSIPSLSKLKSKLEGSKFYLSPNKKYSFLKIGGNNQVKNFSKWLYHNNDFFLERKKNILKNIDTIGNNRLHFDKEILKHISENKSLIGASKHLDCDPETLKKIYKKNNVEYISNYGENELKIDNFFDTLGDKQFEAAGIIISKNYIDPLNRIILSSKATAKKLCNLLNIEYVESHTKYLSSIYLEKLKWFGILEEKIPEHILSHNLFLKYLRGRFSVKASIKKKIIITDSSYLYLESVREFLQKHNIKVNINKAKNWFYIKVNQKDTIYLKNLLLF